MAKEKLPRMLTGEDLGLNIPGDQPTLLKNQEKSERGITFSGDKDPATGKTFETFIPTKREVAPTRTGESAQEKLVRLKAERESKTEPTRVVRGAGVTKTADGATTKAGGVATFDIQEPDMDKIRGEKLSDAQSIIDAINENYSRQLAEEKIAGEGREGRTRGLSVGGGLAGSDFATAAAVKTEKENLEIKQSIEAEQAAVVQNVLNDVKNDTAELYEKRREEFIAQAEDRLAGEKAFQEQTKTDAIDRAKQIASSGAKITDLKRTEREVYNKLVNDSGLTELEFDALANAASPTPVKYSYKELKDGTLLRTGDDGSAEEMGNYAPPEEDDPAWNIEPQVDGSLYWIKKDENGDITDFKKFESTIEKPKTFKPPSQSTVDKQDFKDDIKTMTKELSSITGTKDPDYDGPDDPYISPQNYLVAKKEWIAQGYSPESFDDEFEGFRNPTNTNYSVGGTRAESAFQKTEAEKKKAETKVTETETKKTDSIDKMWGTALSGRKNSGKSREEIEKELSKKYDGVPDDAKNWLDRNF